ncbi:MAG TPA: PHP domain-containing protein [Herpetosiphonaceae bacterium]
MLIDLHTHTIATPHHSHWEPAALAAAAAAAGIGVLAISDHNTTAQVAAARAAAEAAGLRFISGVELDTAFNGKLWHTHVYGLDPADPGLLALCEAVVSRNRADALALADEMRGAGHRLPFLEAIEAERPANLADVAHALVKAGVVPGEPGVEDEAAGMAWLLRQRPDAYHPVTVAEAVAAAHAGGGLAVLAHPGREKSVYAIPADAADIAALAEIGLDGLEAFYPTHSPAQVALYRELAARHGLLVTAGSDSHGPRDGLRGHPAADCAAFLERFGVSA